MARVALSFDAWKEGEVAPAVVEVPMVVIPLPAQKSAQPSEVFPKAATPSQESEGVWKKWNVTSEEEKGKPIIDHDFVALDRVKKVSGKWTFIDDKEPKIMGPKKLEFFGVRVNFLRMEAVAPQLNPDKTSKWIIAIFDFEAQADITIFGKSGKVAVGIERYVKKKLNAGEGVLVYKRP